jgi:(2Fe-2S) ferredoxin
MKTLPYPHGESVVLVCTECKSRKVLKAVREEVKERGMRKQVRVQKCGCLGACGDGPNVLVANGCCRLFSGVRPGDATEIVAAAGGLALAEPAVR